VRRTLQHPTKSGGTATLPQSGEIERAERNATRGAAHKNAVEEAFISGLHDAYAATCPDAEYNELADRLMDDARDYLVDADEMRGDLDSPIGETVVRFCAAMGLDPEACEPDGDTWRIRRPALDFEVRLEEKARKYGAPHPSPSGLGQDA
jgi:hypothetical protein